MSRSLRNTMIRYGGRESGYNSAFQFLDAHIASSTENFLEIGSREVGGSEDHRVVHELFDSHCRYCKKITARKQQDTHRYDRNDNEL